MPRTARTVRHTRVSNTSMGGDPGHTAPGLTTKQKAFAYCRTSSATNVGPDKDSYKRQRAAIESYATAHGIQIAAWFYDAAVSGDDDLERRPAFRDLLDRLEDNGVKLVLVESADRLARKLLTQELGILAARERGTTINAVMGDQNLTNTDDEMKVFLRQVGGAFAQLEKARLVRRLREARERKDAKGGRPQVPAATIALARQLYEDHKSYRVVAAKLAEAGHTVPGKERGRWTGKPYSHEGVRQMLRSEAT